MRTRIHILVILLPYFLGCAATGDSDAVDVFASPPEEAGEVDKYLIGPGDALTVNVWRNPELSLTVPVRPDGFISVPLIGDVRASDLDAERLAGRISQRLESQLRNPQVTVVVSQINSSVYVSRVRVTGAVQSPISIPYARGMSVLDLILEAGGVTELAAPNRARIYRTLDDELYETGVRLNDILLRGDLSTNYQLRPGDVITVPERLF